MSIQTLVDAWWDWRSRLYRWKIETYLEPTYVSLHHDLPSKKFHTDHKQYWRRHMSVKFPPPTLECSQDGEIGLAVSQPALIVVEADLSHMLALMKVNLSQFADS